MLLHQAGLIQGSLSRQPFKAQRQPRAPVEVRPYIGLGSCKAIAQPGPIQDLVAQILDSGFWHGRRPNGSENLLKYELYHIAVTCEASNCHASFTTTQESGKDSVRRLDSTSNL